MQGQVLGGQHRLHRVNY